MHLHTPRSLSQLVMHTDDILDWEHLGCDLLTSIVEGFVVPSNVVATIYLYSFIWYGLYVDTCLGSIQ